MSTTAFKNIVYKSEFFNKCLTTDITDTTAIVIDSMNMIDNLKTQTPEQEIEGYVLRQISTGNKANHICNYAISRDGIIYKITPNNRAGKACQFDVYSAKASMMFPVECPPTDARLSPRNYGPDKKLISIIVATDNTNDSTVDTGIMNYKSKNTLVSLCAYIVCSAKSNNISISNQDIILRSMFPGETAIKDQCGHVGFRNNILSFMTFKREVLNAANTSPKYDQLFSKESDIII